MGECLNISGVHNNGSPELRVGIRGKEFLLTLDSDTGIISLKNPLNNKKLSLSVEDILTDKIIAYLTLGENEVAGGEILSINADNTISPNTITITDLSDALEALKNKATKATTLGGYGIVNAYTKKEIDNKLLLENLPYELKERIYFANNEDEVYALQKNPIHNGDIIYTENETEQNLYFVVDDNYLGSTEAVPNSWTTAANLSNLLQGPVFYVCYGKDKFVTVANSKYFAYSTDGITWTESTISSTKRYWYSVCYGNDKFVAVADYGYFAYSTDGITWTEGTISSTSRDWYSVCYGNDKYVAVANSDTYFAYSTDGITWTEGTISSTSRQWYSVCYGNDKYVAVAYGDNYFAYSTDGITWTEGTISDTSRNWESVCYGNDKYVAVALNTNYFAYSTDGITWTEGTISTTSRDWYSVCYGNGKFVAVGCTRNDSNETISGNFAYSTDGITWTEGTISSTNRKWYYVCYGNDKFVAVDGQDDVAYLTFTLAAENAFTKVSVKKLIDGSIITGEISINNLPKEVKERVYEVNTENDVYSLTKDIIHNGDIVYTETEDEKCAYFVIDDSHLGYNNIFWDDVKLNNTYTDRNWTSVCYGKDKFVTVASSSKYFAYSYDGITWTEGTISSTNRNWWSVCYGKDKYVAIADSSNYFAYSTDGITWTEGTISSTSRQWFSVCYGNGKFVAVAYNSNYFAYSTDGITWTEGTISSTSRKWRSVCYGKDKFVAVAESTKYFAYSTDGITWIEGTISNTSRYWSSVCYGNDKFVAVAEDSNYFAYSTDGITWTEGTSAAYRSWWSVCYGNDKFVTVANSDTYFAYSTDGITWTEGTIGSSKDRRCICYGEGKYVSPAYNDYFASYSTLLPRSASAFRKITEKKTINAYTKNEIDNMINDIITSITAKADKSTTLAGYGITDAYTKNEIDNTVRNINTSLSKKANASDIPTITASTTAPTSSTTGKAGDLYVIYSK